MESFTTHIDMPRDATYVETKCELHQQHGWCRIKIISGDDHMLTLTFSELELKELVKDIECLLK